MRTLHLLRSEPDDQVRELIEEITPGEVTTIALYDEPAEYDDLLEEIFNHDLVISWW